ncbi:MAG TPA: HIT domain-containing protein [bacterium]|nr:HIT domain-containing protein [bacterium]
MAKNKKQNFISEFRKDTVSGEWVLISSMRRMRPHFLKSANVRHGAESQRQNQKLKKDCPFENPQKSGNSSPILWYPSPKSASQEIKDWFIQIIPNRYPVFPQGSVCPTTSALGPYEKIDGMGFHEVIVFRDHGRDFKKMSIDEIGLVLKAYKERYKMLEKEQCIEYILIFHNKGELAGASIAHPHSQLVALPIVPPDVSRSINGGINFFEKNKKCVHCVMLDWERKEKKRIVFENKHFTTFTPYASRVSYEVRIFPREHSSDFEEISREAIPYLAESLKDALSRIGKTLNNPDYNFFIHTASAKVKNVPYYHWHIEILPRTDKWAGLELGTGIEVVAVSPERAAENLRNSL